jgi:hypothetical protein
MIISEYDNVKGGEQLGFNTSDEGIIRRDTNENIEFT